MRLGRLGDSVFVCLVRRLPAWSWLNWLLDLSDLMECIMATCASIGPSSSLVILVVVLFVANLIACVLHLLDTGKSCTCLRQS